MGGCRSSKEATPLHPVVPKHSSKLFDTHKDTPTTSAVVQSSAKYGLPANQKAPDKSTSKSTHTSGTPQPKSNKPQISVQINKQAASNNKGPHPEPPTPDTLSQHDAAAKEPSEASSRSSSEDGHFKIFKEGEQDDRQLENQWKRVKVLGEGGFGEVHLAVNGEGAFRAVKTVTVVGDDPAALRRHYKALKRELVALRALGEHPNIVHHYKAVAEGNKLHIFMDYCEEGSLRQQYLDHGKMSLELTARYIRDILSGLDFLHSSNMIHRDIKAANVLIQKKGGCAKLADFGAAAIVEDVSRRTCVGTVHWMAPEVVSADGHRWHADIWSVGCTAMELITGKPPFLHISKLPAKIGKFVVQNFDIDKALPTCITCPDLKNFITQCLQVDRERRPSAKELLRHPFITTYADKPEASQA